MEDEQEIKQSYLRKEILEKNYDTQLFLDFLITKKGDKASDINNWTIEELKTVVSEFQNSRNNNNQKENTSSNYLLEDLPPAENEVLKINSIITPFSSSNRNPNINNERDSEYNNYFNDGNNEWLFAKRDKNERFSISNFININQNIYAEEIDCLEPDHSPFSNYEEIKIKISSPKKEYDSSGLKGFFVKTIYYSFLLENDILKINRRRKYTDFEWLRKTLCRLFPGNYIPPLPLKTLNANKPDKIEKYQAYLQRFIDGIMEDKLLKNSSLIYLFISTEKEKDLIFLMEKYDKVQRPKHLKYFYSREGKIILDENILKKPKKDELLNLKTKIANNSNIIQTLNNSLKALSKEMKQVSDRMIEISNLYKMLYELCVNNSEKGLFCKCYSDLSLFFKEYGNKELEQMKIISHEIKDYFKFVNLQYILSFKELYNSFEYQYNLYYKVAENLKQKKEFLYNSKNIEKWELKNEDRNIDLNDKDTVMNKMLPKDTAVVNEIKKYLIYYATQLDSENERVKDNICKHNNIIIKNLKDNSVKILCGLKKFLELI
jgi:hypothetical protein